MWADMHMATGVSAIVKKSLLLFVTTAAGSLCFAAPSALGQNWGARRNFAGNVNSLFFSGFII
jgi:hypothetical protein